jgi:hypothetical protein
VARGIRAARVDLSPERSLVNESRVAKAYTDCLVESGEDERRAEAQAKALVAALKVYDLMLVEAKIDGYKETDEFVRKQSLWADFKQLILGW